jgi:hypothetical protein
MACALRGSQRDSRAAQAGPARSMATRRDGRTEWTLAGLHGGTAWPVRCAAHSETAVRRRPVLRAQWLRGETAAGEDDRAAVARRDGRLLRRPPARGSCAARRPQGEMAARQ